MNLEDIGNKTCFKILEALQKKLGRLVWHDDQQGTALVVVASLLAALKIQGKDSPQAIQNLRIAIAGAGAAGIVCGRLIRKALKRLCPDFDDDRILMQDSHGLIAKNRTDLTNEKRMFVVDTTFKTLQEAMSHHPFDVFLGVSPVGTFRLGEDEVKNMGRNPIIMALANPDPEILPEEVEAIRQDAIVFTGRSDRKNQANNANSFPGILAGGLDGGATKSTDEMILEAAFAMANIAFEKVPEKVQSLYDYELKPGSRDYAIPTAYDPRVHFRVALAAARAAMKGAVDCRHLDERDYAHWFWEARLRHALVMESPSVLLGAVGSPLFQYSP